MAQLSAARRVLIDLGDMSAAPQPAAEEDPPRPRRLIGFTVAALAVLLSAGGAPPAPPLFDPPVRLTLPASEFTLVGDTLYAVSERGRLEAYELPHGVRRWTSTVEVHGPFYPERVGDLVLLTTAADAERVVALDARTGVVRWDHRGTPIYLDPASRSMVLIEPPNPIEGAPDPELGSLTAINLADGRSRWTFPAPDSRIRMTPVYGAVPGASTQIVGLLHTTSGGPQLFDLATGSDTPVPPVGAQGPLQFGEGTYEAVAGGLLVVASGAPGRPALRAYDRATMRPRWIAMPGELVTSVEGCGPWLCATTADETAAVDPSDGRVLWRVVEWFVVRAGDGDRSVAFRIRSNGPLGVAVLRTDTGRILLTLEDWRPLVLGFAHRLPVLRRDIDGRVELAVLDVDHGTSHRIGDLRTNVSDPCDANETYLVCRTAPGRLQVWRYQPGG